MLGGLTKKLVDSVSCYLIGVWVIFVKNKDMLWDTKSLKHVLELFDSSLTTILLYILVSLEAYVFPNHSNMGLSVLVSP